MDDFVRNKLTEWGLSDLREKFKDEGIDKESLLRLEDHHIDSLIPKKIQRAKFTKHLKLLKEESKKPCQEAEDVSNAGPSTSNSSKRRSDPQGKQPPTKKRKNNRNGPLSDANIHSSVKEIMSDVYDKLKQENQTSIQPFIDFLKTKIDELGVNKRELVGVFGRTGAGKSYLLNAIIEMYNFLPTRVGKACTSVMIKVEANTRNPKYEAEIEFIPKEEWSDEVEQQDTDDEERLLAVYGKEWRNISPKNCMDKKYFKEILEFLDNASKSLSCQSAEELSAKLIQYIRSDSSEGTVKRWYWPLVKCVTVRVPNNPLLQHVTLVDLPGYGDRNKSRNKMWKELVGSCSTVWIVTEINRAGSDSGAWKILESACSEIGNGGQCQQIHFICTKTDQLDDSDESNESDESDECDDLVVKKCKKTKRQVLKEFKEQNNIKKHFSNDCLKVFTVSAKQFLKRKRSKPTTLQEEDTEIPALQGFLKQLNDHHSEKLNDMYVCGAYGFLSLMQGARSRDTADAKTKVRSQLVENLKSELQKIKKTTEETYEDFEKRLTKGVKNSESSCDATLKSFLNPDEGGRGFHRTLSCIVRNDGSHSKKPINLNEMLSSKLTDSIDVEFRKTFPNKGKHSPISEVISTFSLDTEKLIEKYKDVELQLIFLKTEEKQIKTKLHQIIRDEKRKVYSSLTEMIEEAMKDGYKEARKFRGEGSLQKMRKKLEDHLHLSKNIMFKEAKDAMLQKLQNLMDKIQTELEDHLNKSIELSLKTDDHSIPDFSEELELVNKYYKDLKDRPNE
ncbi:nuclear GTPase SLIP-GC-like isoform X2 [Betta splendens]|uniref:Nuclear GTPase SLIP-GC-like isoform X2 n=1 Tax=Betta splendens TaxID=158456 RepID=A0A8M1HGY4_BETSP|nr:nuclear GTPase SLIP-GC-like isoform X2 [Betta splendens]